MTTREDFEKELLKQFKHDQGMIAFNESAGEYVDWQAQTQWSTWQACAAHYEAERNALLALIAEKDKALRLAKSMGDLLDASGIVDHALSITHDSVRIDKD